MGTVLVSVFALLLPFFATNLCAQVVPLSKTYNWKMSTSQPAGHHNNWLSLQFIEQLEKRTAGKVKITYYQGTLGSPTDQWEMLKGNAIQIAALADAYNVPRMPIITMLNLPFAVGGYKNTMTVFDEWYKAGLLKEITDNFQMLAFQVNDQQHLFFIKKKVSTLEEIKGMKLRALSALHGQSVTALGATAVSMPAGEVYMAMQTGVIDGAVTAISGFMDRKFGEVCKYALKFSNALASGGWVIAMNKETWDGLPKELQNLMMEIMHSLVPEDTNRTIALEESDYERAKKMGVTVYTLPPQEEARWRKAVADVDDKYVASLTAKGLPGKRAQEIMQKVTGIK
jgi:TRAP-type transport system periplasmic protein